ncbi:MAG: hypothetical protein LBQ83_03730 [Candidatus Margulisbacteria bacterium]|jgi:hypothetical protein|nr:hypothetical protein [Candidatus Margulisiibacteriota bacterium]
MKTAVSGVMRYINKNFNSGNSPKLIMELDDIVNHELELIESSAKELAIKETIKEINQSAVKAKIASKNKEYFENLNDYCKGKLFYIAYKESRKYLKFKEIDKILDKNTLLGFVSEIETGQEYGWKLIDNLQNNKLKNFLYGIFTYLYF